MDANDFIPTEADIEVDAPFFRDDIQNFADNEEIASNTQITIDDYESRFMADREPWADENGIWKLCDWAWHSCIDNAQTLSEEQNAANTPDDWNRAKIGTPQFYRQTIQKAANAYTVMTSKDMPFRYSSLTNDTVAGSDSKTISEERRLNLLAKYSMKRDKFNEKALDFFTQLYKYSNVPVMVEWVSKRGKKTERIKDPATGEYELVELDNVITDNRPVFSVMPVDSVLADVNIGTIQEQECVIVQSLIGISDIVDNINSGLYRDDLLKDLKRSYLWDGASGSVDHEKNRESAKYSNSTPCDTGKYLKREVFVNLPIGADGKWDDKENIPVRYRVTLLGNCPTDSLVARIERNQEPDDSIPIEIIHANSDDSTLLYHISNFEVIRSDLSTEITVTRQMLDNNGLINRPPLKEVRGEVEGNDRCFGPDARFICTEMGSIDFMKIAPFTQDNLALLNYIRERANSANSLDKNQSGESFGARTSRGEADTIKESSGRPNIVNIEYIFNQLFGFYSKHIKLGWETYGISGQMIQITDENDANVKIDTGGVNGDFDIVVDVIDDIKDQTIKSQQLTQYATIANSIPGLSQTTDWEGLNKEIQETILGTSKYVVPSAKEDAIENANRNIELMMISGQAPQIPDGADLKAHLEIYQGHRLKWKGYEEQNPNVFILDNAIEELKQRTAQQKQGQVNPQQPLQAGSAIAGQQASAALGG